MVFDAPGRLSRSRPAERIGKPFAEQAATMSLGPPVVTGTTKRMLLVGYSDWLRAANGATAFANDAVAISM